MVAQSYDIFRRDADAEIWVEAVRDFETAKTRVIELAAEAPGQYVVFSQRSGRMVSSGTVLASPAARATENKEAEGPQDSSEKEQETLW